MNSNLRKKHDRLSRAGIHFTVTSLTFKLHARIELVGGTILVLIGADVSSPRDCAHPLELFLIQVGGP